jgi:hypothetical protein
LLPRGAPPKTWPAILNRSCALFVFSMVSMGTLVIADKNSFPFLPGAGHIFLADKSQLFSRISTFATV